MALHCKSNAIEVNAPMPVDGKAPFTIGFWLKVFDDVLGPGVIYMTDNTLTDHYIGVYENGGNGLNFECQQTGGSPAAVFAGFFSPNSWNYVVIRGVSTTSKRFSLLAGGTQVITHSQLTNTADMSGCNALVLGGIDISPGGAQASADIGFAEYFAINADIQPDGGQLQDSTIKQLAYGGPFSIPNLRGNIRDYMSFRSDPYVYNGGLHTAYRLDETYFGAGLKGTDWSAVGGSLPTRIDHPSLPYSHANPTDHSRVLMI